MWGPVLRLQVWLWKCLCFSSHCNWWVEFKHEKQRLSLSVLRKNLQDWFFCAVCHDGISMHWSCAAGKYLPCFYKKLLECQKQRGEMCVVWCFCKSLQKSFRNFCMAFIPLCNMDITGPLPASGPARQWINVFFSQKYANTMLKATAIFLCSLVFA